MLYNQRICVMSKTLLVQCYFPGPKLKREQRNGSQRVGAVCLDPLVPITCMLYVTISMLREVLSSKRDLLAK
jgi:hypothetical protein